VPTSRPRHVITETDEVARALDDAARRWPDERSRSRLVLRLLAEGHRVLTAGQEQHVEARRAAVQRTSGALADVYEPGYLERLRDDWPS
jgi:hypothetical protein